MSDTTPEITHADIEAKLTELLAEDWRNSTIASALLDGVRRKKEHLRYQMARGKQRNTAANRGYLQALIDLEQTLTDNIGKENNDAATEITEEGS